MTVKGRSLYEMTADAVREDIRSGKLVPGDQVGPSLWALAAEHHVGVGTMRAALGLLSDEGLVETIPGKGTFVLASAPQAAARDGQDEWRREAGELRRDHEALRRDFEELQADVMDIRAKSGLDQPSRQQDNGRTRREHAG